MQKMFLAMMERMDKADARHKEAEARHTESLVQMDARNGERMERMTAHLSSASSGPPGSGPSVFSSSRLLAEVSVRFRGHLLHGMPSVTK